MKRQRAELHKSKSRVRTFFSRAPYFKDSSTSNHVKQSSNQLAKYSSIHLGRKFFVFYTGGRVLKKMGRGLSACGPRNHIFVLISCVNLIV